mmetsp:Transcript_24266/g.66394  ORF Transcript_24266/g.66394 Transcript_24266/m.66394 type:complete len:163 (-) Transcript_24266:459-947(-)
MFWTCTGQRIDIECRLILHSTPPPLPNFIHFRPQQTSSWCRSTLQGALQEFSHREPRGEICIVLEGADGAPQSPIQGPPGVNAEQEGPAGGDAASTLVGTAPGVSPEQERARPMLMRLIASGVPMSAAAKDVAKQLGMSRKELYNVAMQVQAQVLSEKRRDD